MDHNPIVPCVLWCSNCSSFNVPWEMADFSTRARNTSNQPWASCTTSKCHKNTKPHSDAVCTVHGTGTMKGLVISLCESLEVSLLVLSTELNVIVETNIRIQTDLTHFQVIWLQDYNLSVLLILLHYIMFIMLSIGTVFLLSPLCIFHLERYAVSVLAANYCTQTHWYP